ncbi:MAG: 50S ribosomal protein L19 [Phycisphaerae bacterium]|nr:MAG: 50S ribosomal protein L19 [Planctomycetota bacterium]GJQ25569.1 MAG: 50S ribosomal protein L19 [Phycisphaerae bacterium]
MRNRIIEAIEQEHYRKDVPKFEIGDTVSVGVRIIEGTKERIQPFIGTVIAIHGKGMNQTFTVRRIVANEGVERIFPMQSPRVVGVEVIRHGKVRRGKLFYLRDRVGKSRKLRERRMGTEDAGESAESAPAGAASRNRSTEAAVATV